MVDKVNFFLIWNSFPAISFFYVKTVIIKVKPKVNLLVSQAVSHECHLNKATALLISNHLLVYALQLQEHRLFSQLLYLFLLSTKLICQPQILIVIKSIRHFATHQVTMYHLFFHFSVDYHKVILIDITLFFDKRAIKLCSHYCLCTVLVLITKQPLQLILLFIYLLEKTATSVYNFILVRLV